MERFSFYELLSFIIPGAFALVLIQLYTQAVFGETIYLPIDNALLETLFILSVALLIGVLVHMFNFAVLDRKGRLFKWYKELVFKSIDKISSESSHISDVLPFLKECYIKLGKHHKDKKIEDVSAGEVFDFVYNYLEVTDKIGPGKNFQSLYFWLRNVLLICLIFFVAGAVLAAALFIFCIPDFSHLSAILFPIANLIFSLVLILPIQWLRKKMIMRMFWNYYTDRVHREEENNK